MAKIIKMTEQEIDRLKDEFIEALRGMKMADGKVSYSKDFGKIERRAKLVFTEIAWLKQSMLINEFDKEVAWHGIAKRGDEPNEFIISDIIVYPQEVTGSTVNTDQERYQEWLYSNPDEVFNNIRMQGHSHVNMGVTPSGVDTSLYERLLGQLDDTMFYIFLIWNKKGEKTIKIYDMRENVLYETADVDVEVLDEGFGFGKFIDDAKEMVKTKTYQYSPTQGAYNANHGGYNYYKSTNPPAATQQSGKPKAQKSTGKEKKKKSYGVYNNWRERFSDESYYDSMYGWD